MKPHLTFPLLPLLALIPCLTSAADLDWEPYVYPKNQIFPSLIIGTATVAPDEEDVDPYILGDPVGLIGASITNPEADTKVTVEVLENDFINASRVTVTLEEADELYDVAPKISYKYAALQRVRQTIPCEVAVSVKVGSADPDIKSLTARVRPVHDCLFALEDDDDEQTEPIDFAMVFSCYVNEDHPWVSKILKKALDAQLVPSFDGYQSGDPERVILQVFAVWNALQESGIRYSDITATSAAVEGVYSQHVRFLDESLESAQANCVDGSVMFASVLRKIGIHPFLVLVPGHMFVGFYLDNSDDPDFLCLETTLLGSTDLPSVAEAALPLNQAPEEAKQLASWDSFEAAVDAGLSQYQEGEPHFDDESQVRYQLIDIQIARELGFIPIASNRDP